MSTTEDIKSKLDIVDYISRYVPDLKKAGRYYKACCPFHSEKTPSFVVNPDRQSWRCFGACAEGGDVFSFAMKLHGWDFKETLENLGELTGVEVQRQSPRQKAAQQHLDRLRGLLSTAAEYYHAHLMVAEDEAARAVMHYAQEKRGFTRQTLEAFQIGYAPDGWQTMLDALRKLGYKETEIIQSGMAIRNDKGRVYDRFRHRLMVPIRDERGRVVGFGARALNPDDNPKYLNSPQTPVFDKSRLLFGLDAAKGAIRERETAVIVEGYMDAVQAHQAGYRNVVAQMGTALTEAQLKLVVPRYAQRVIMALDADDAGQNATRRSLETARKALQADYAGRLAVDIRILQIPGAKDPDDLLREEPEAWPDLIDAAQPVADFVIALETAHLKPNASLQERKAIAARVLPLLAASEDNLYRQENLQKLALKLRIAETALMQWARELQKQQANQRPAATPQPPPPRDMPPGLQQAASQMPPSMDEAPPPGFHNPDSQPPLDGDDDEAALSREQADPLETYSLALLLRDPNLMFQINRRLRLLANGDGRLLAQALADFGPDDFTRSDYRQLMRLVVASVRQVKMDPHDYLSEHLDESLMPIYAMLRAEERLHHEERLAGRLRGDFTVEWKQHARKHLLRLDHATELTSRAFNLRKRRLERELDEMRFLLMDVPEGAANLAGDADLMLMRGLHRLNEALRPPRFADSVKP